MTPPPPRSTPVPYATLLAFKLPPPSGTLLAPQLTVPPGAVADSSVLSVTVAVQLLGLPTGTVSGVHVTTALTACSSTPTSNVPTLLRWVPSPLYLPVMLSVPTTAGV